ncbi:MAG TPA: hypothetical protein VGQ42_08455 [Candidatus Dormibacteraeota bacterium]|jgi:hypothetical protein|nr:hypothetical protein [Candidatus Dormibacteraeota bacterium]
MRFAETLPPALRRPVDQLVEAATPVVDAVRDAAGQARDTAVTLAYAYVGALDLAQERLLQVARLPR